MSATFLNLIDTRQTREILRSKEAFIVDCDGVMYHGNHLLPGAKEFAKHLAQSGKKYVFLTNSSSKSAEEIVEKFQGLGIQTTTEHVYTSAMCCASFVAKQKPAARVFVMGSNSLKQEFSNAGLYVVDNAKAEMSTPDFVVVGECNSSDLYNFEAVDFAVRMVRRGARLVGTNEDIADRLGNELEPGTGSLILPISATSGMAAYFVGKPNPLMVRSAMIKMDSHSETTVVIGDRMNTDIRAGVESCVDTILVLSGCTSPADVLAYAYRPTIVLPGVGDIVSLVED